MDNDTRILLNLTDPHLSFSRHWLKFAVVKSVRVAQISCRLSYTPKACPNCGVINRGQIVKFGYYQAKYKYGQFRAQPLMLRVKTQRFRCPDCQSTFNATSDLFTDHHSVTAALRREVILQLCRVRTIKDIAHDLFVSETTVQRVLRDLADQFQPDWNYLPQTLCIDEFKSMRSAQGKMSFIAVDGSKKGLLELLEDRRLRSLFEHYQRFSYQARRHVKYLVMDMNAAYERLAKTVFPNAQVVYDRFHIAKHLNDTMNHVRIHVYQRLCKGDRQAQKQARRIKHYWRLFLQDQTNLNTDEYYEGRYFHRIVNSVTILDLMLAYDEELSATYNHIQALKYAYNQKDFKRFFRLLNLRSEGLSHYTVHRCHVLARYQKGIRLGFQQEFSNGQTEGFNNRIKLIKRVAFGYRCFETFRTRVYLTMGKQIQVS